MLELLQRERGKQTAVLERCHHDAEEQAAVLRNHGAESYAVEAYELGEHYARHNVYSVDYQVFPHRRHRVLLAYEPARKDQQREGSRCGPYPYQEIFLRKCRDFLRGVGDQGCEFEEGPLENKQDCRHSECDAEPSPQHLGRCTVISRSVCLGRQSAGTGAQEGEVPVEQRQKHRADRYGSNGRSGAYSVQMP